MREYLNLLQRVLDEGEEKDDRTGTGTRSVFGAQLRCRMSEGFPVLTTKKLHLKSIIEELVWFIGGNTNVRPLQEKGVSIWNEWADADGELGPVYGYQWRHWGARDGNPGIDQLEQLVSDIKTNPNSRRHIVSAWNVEDVPRMKLPPCHLLFQCYVSKSGKLSLHMYQRSADIFLGVPFNIASYALLLKLLAHDTGLQEGDLVISFGDVHLYNNHVEQARLQLSRDPRPLPRMNIGGFDNLFKFRYENAQLENYDPHPAIKAPIAV